MVKVNNMNKLQELLLSLPDGDHYIKTELFGECFLINKNQDRYNSKIAKSQATRSYIINWTIEDFGCAAWRSATASVITKDDFISECMPKWQEMRESLKGLLSVYDRTIKAHE